MYDQGLEFIGPEFIKSLIEEEYGITAKPRTLGNTMSNVVLERIHQSLGNSVWIFNISQTYIDKNDRWAVILAESETLSTTNRQKGYSPVQLIFGRDMVLLIKHRVDWELIGQRKQTQINKDNIRSNIYIVYYDYKVGYNVMLTNHTVYKY